MRFSLRSHFVGPQTRLTRKGSKWKHLETVGYLWKPSSRRSLNLNKFNHTCTTTNLLMKLNPTLMLNTGFNSRMQISVEGTDKGDDGRMKRKCGHGRFSHWTSFPTAIFYISQDSTTYLFIQSTFIFYKGLTLLVWNTFSRDSTQRACALRPD